MGPRPCALEGVRGGDDFARGVEVRCVHEDLHPSGEDIIAADDLDAALGWASKVVDVINMPIEVRPFWEEPGA